ncbi:unnamed protein product [Enterobius vermicularis]|uniref:Dynein light chain n=1 Tax=Enterobius vermicularis TaxID=51028 RepID=A0A0N4V8M6_ENTVE|nr:unnamed protein product [Enterobius vermicularis]
MINEAGGEEEMDITDLPIRLQEYIRGIKDAADRQSNDVIRNVSFALDRRKTTMALMWAREEVLVKSEQEFRRIFQTFTDRFLSTSSCLIEFCDELK